MKTIDLSNSKYAVINTSTGRFPAPHRYTDQPELYYKETKKPLKHEQFESAEDAKANLKNIEEHTILLKKELNGNTDSLFAGLISLLKSTKLEVVKIRV